MQLCHSSGEESRLGIGAAGVVSAGKVASQLTRSESGLIQNGVDYPRGLVLGAHPRPVTLWHYVDALHVSMKIYAHGPKKVFRPQARGCGF